MTQTDARDPDAPDTAADTTAHGAPPPDDAAQPEATADDAPDDAPQAAAQPDDAHDDTPDDAPDDATQADAALEAAEVPAPQPQDAPDDEARAMIPPLMILYDGECGLCHGAVRAMMDADRYGAFHYAPLQGETTARLRARHPGRIPENLESVVFVEGDRVHLRTRAFIHAARYLPWPWRLAWWLRVIPAPLADVAYDAIAAVRYQVFGKKDLCELPAPDVRQRFLP